MRRNTVYKRAVGALTIGAVRIAETVAPRYVERKVAHAFLTPRKGRARSRRFDLPEPDQSVRVCVDGMWIAAWRWGEGPAVMLVHGWEDDHRTFAAIITALRRQGRAVVAFDLPAHGRSGGEIAILPTIARAIRQLSALLGPVSTIAGHSFGGAAVTYALAQGAKAERAVIIAAPVSIARALDFVSKRLRLSPARKAGIHEELHRRTGVTVESLELEPMAAQLPSVPALIIHSRDDTMVMAHSSERLAQAWPGATLMMVDGLGHRRVLSDPAMVARVVSFLCGGVPAQASVG